MDILTLQLFQTKVVRFFSRYENCLAKLCILVVSNWLGAMSKFLLTKMLLLRNFQKHDYFKMLVCLEGILFSRFRVL